MRFAERGGSSIRHKLAEWQTGVRRKVVPHLLPRPASFLNDVGVHRTNDERCVSFTPTPRKALADVDRQALRTCVVVDYPLIYERLKAPESRLAIIVVASAGWVGGDE